MHSERIISELIGLIYDAAGDASRWPVFLEKFGQVLNSPANNIMDASHQRAYAGGCG